MDVLHDNSFRQWSQIGVALKGTIPDYVSNYTPLEEKDASTLPDEVFADPGKRLFPLDSPANTWLSGMYYAQGNPTFSVLEPEKLAATWNRVGRLPYGGPPNSSMTFLASSAKCCSSKIDFANSEAGSLPGNSTMYVSPDF